ncbi:MAG: glycosyltransferase family 4 protein, partial [Desulfofustis sp.]
APVILSAAMLRSGVKSAGIRQLISSCRELQNSAQDFILVIVGDGRQRADLEQAARQALGSRCLFVGKVPRQELYRYYSAADLFAFPGIEESLGMVYLEAQSAGLPVVAFRAWGASEVVFDGQTGLLAPASQPELFTNAIRTLLNDTDLRKRLGRQARQHVIKHHDLKTNYRFLDEQLRTTVQHNKRSG